MSAFSQKGGRRKKGEMGGKREQRKEKHRGATTASLFLVMCEQLSCDICENNKAGFSES